MNVEDHSAVVVQVCFIFRCIFLHTHLHLSWHLIGVLLYCYIHSYSLLWHQRWSGLVRQLIPHRSLVNTYNTFVYENVLSHTFVWVDTLQGSSCIVICIHILLWHLHCTSCFLMPHRRHRNRSVGTGLTIDATQASCPHYNYILLYIIFHFRLLHTQFSYNS